MIEEIIKDMSLKEKMSLYRQGLISLPQEYTDLHLEKAEKRLNELVELGLEVTNKEIKSQGWGDGFKVIHATLIDKRNGNTANVKWHDGNQEFFYKSDTGGAFPLRFKDNFKFLR